jgi:hypothetical protein
MTNMADLPREVQDEIGAGSAPDSERMEAIAQLLVAKRKEYIGARLESGIEDVWRKAEEAYVGIDDANRAEWGKAKWAKPTSMTGPVTTNNKQPNDGTRSNAFVRLTSRYVDAGAAKLGEILLPIDDKAFSFGPTPVPDLIKAKEDTTQVQLPDGTPAMRDARPEEMAAMQPEGAAPGAQPGAPVPGVPLTVKDLAEEAVKIATTKAEKAEKRVYDWMVESRYPMQMRKVIFDAARIGVGVVKGPYPDEKRTQAIMRVPGGVELQIKKVIRPCIKWVSPWNIYPDPACGEDIQDGDGVFEKDSISERQLRKLKALPGYIARAIDQVIAEGPEKCNVDGSDTSDRKNKHQYTIWYYHGTLKREDMEALQAEGMQTTKPDQTEIYALVTMVNDTPIRASVNVLDSGKHPYHAIPWKRRPGQWAGVGIGEQVDLPQRMINSATRAGLNNAGKSAGSIIVVDRTQVIPADGNWVIGGGDKVFYTAPDSTMEDVRKAFATFQIPNMTPQLMQWVEYALRLAEESTSIPLISQGQTGPTSPDTYGQAQLQNNNANQLLRDIGYQFDDYGTEPIVTMYYEWLLMDPEVPEDEKGDFEINAHGSIALVERAIQDQTILQMGGMVLNPAFGASPARWFEQLAKSKRLDPRDFQLTDEEKQAMASKPPPEAPAVTAARVRAQSAEKIASGSQQVDQARAKADIDRDTAFVQAETARTDNEHQARMAELAVKERLAMLDYANKRDLTLAEVKAQLAESAAKINLQRELALNDNAIDYHKHENPSPDVLTPPVEPAGRAPNGQAFER